MRVFRLWGFWLWGWIILPGVLYAQVEESSVKKIELQRIGQQLNVHLFFDTLPIYEIYENLISKVLLFKLQNARLGLQQDQQEHLYNDPILEGIRFSQEGNEVWVQFKTRIPDLIYAVKNSQPQVLTVELRKKTEVEPLEPPPTPPTLRLRDVRFTNHPPDFSRATFFFARSKEPRMFFRQDKERKTTTIRFSDTHPVAELEINATDPGNRILFDKMETDANQTFITITSTGPMEVKEMFLRDPPRWVIDFFGEPGEEEPEVQEEVIEEELTEEERIDGKSKVA